MLLSQNFLIFKNEIKLKFNKIIFYIWDDESLWTCMISIWCFILMNSCEDVHWMGNISRDSKNSDLAAGWQSRDPFSKAGRGKKYP
jgi:hypothetical protein